MRVPLHGRGGASLQHPGGMRVAPAFFSGFSGKLIGEAVVRIRVQFRIVGDDDTVINDDGVLRLDKTVTVGYGKFREPRGGTRS
jgi:hypothetical protein